MTTIRKSRLVIALMTVVLALSVLFGVMVLRDNKPTAKAEESISVTQVQFRSNTDGSFFFLRMNDQTDYTTANQWFAGDTLTCNVLDKVTVYFINGAYSLREVWRGDAYGTYIFENSHTLAFPMKAGFYDNQGIGAKIDAGTEIPMNSGVNKVTAESRSFWNTGTGSNAVLDVYTDGFEAMEASLNRIHIRIDGAYSHLMIGLGAGNDWEGKGEGICTQAQAADGTSTYASIQWRKLYLANFTSKIKLHVKETNTWVNYGSIICGEPSAQWAFVYNGWGEEGGIFRLRINSDYNGMTVDKVLFEEGCELPSYAFNAADIEHTVHVLDKAYLCESNDMSAAQATNWTLNDAVKVTFNGANDTYVKLGDSVSYPTAISETKPDDENGSYIYNWFLNGEIYDFTTPVTEEINLTSDGTFTLVEPMDSVIYLNEDGSVYATERYPKDAEISLLSPPSKIGHKGVWKTLDGESAPAVMPDGDVTLQLVYTKDFYVSEVQFRTNNGEPYFFLRFNVSDYMESNKLQDPAFVKETNLLDKVTVYFKDGQYKLRDIWEGTIVFTYLWGDDHTLAFKLVNGFTAPNGVGAKIDEGAEVPMESGILTLDMTRTFWTDDPNRGDDYAVKKYVEGYKEIETTVDGVYVDERLIIDLGEGNDWAGHDIALPTQAQNANGDSSWASSNWSIMYLTNFQEKVKLHLKESDTWIALGDAMALMGDKVGHPQWMFIFNAWGGIDGSLSISIDNERYNGMTIDQVLFEKGCQLPSYDAAAGMGYIMHVLTDEVYFFSNDTSAVSAVDWSKKCKVTFNGENESYLDVGTVLEYPTDLSETKPATAEYTYVYNWFADGEVYDFSKPITGSINLTSNGSYTEIPNEYKVTYYALDGSTVLYTDVFAYGEELTVRSADSIVGYTNCSWIYNGDGGVPTTMPAKDIFFTVQGTAKTYTLTVFEESITVTYAQPIGELPALPEEEGYSAAWAIMGEALTADSIWLFDEDKAAEPHYTANTYTLYLGEESMVVTYGQPIGQLPEILKKEHYVGVWEVEDTALNADMVWGYASDKTAEAIYVVVNYTVTFDGENEAQYAYGSKIEQPVDPTKESTAECAYVFEAWYNGDVKWNFDTDVVEGDLDLVAKYTETKKLYTVSFNVKGHTLTLEPIEVAYGDSLDLTDLFTEDEAAGYTYSITVNGIEKASIKVFSDVTVEITFTEKADAPADTDKDSASDDNGGAGMMSQLGCSGVVGGLSAGLMILTAAGAALVCKKKED